MKLIKCYVSSFGKLKDFTYDFSSGLNTVKEDNGWGKSTLATFIKAMFYGLDGSSKRSISDNERKKFKPWNSTETFGGYVEFEWGGQQFKIERYFGNKENDDTVKLSDLRTGKVYNNTNDLGKRIFEIDEEGFLSTTYFSQKDFEIKSNVSITAKFNSLCSNGDTDSFELALSKIEQKAKTYKYSGDRGKIADARRELFYTEEEIEKATRAIDNATVIKREVEEISVEVERLKAQTAVLTEKVTVAGRAEAVAIKKQRYDELVLEKTELEDEMRKINAILKDNAPNEQELSAYNQCVNELHSVKIAKNTIQEELNSIEQGNVGKEKAISKRTVLSTLVIALLFFIEGITTVWFNPILGAIGFGLFVVCAVCFFAIYKNSSKDKVDDALSKLLEERKVKLQKYSELETHYSNTLEEFLSKFEFSAQLDFRSAITVIGEMVVKKRTVYEKLEKVKQLLLEYHGDLSVFSSSETKVENISILRAELHQVQNAYTEKSGLLASKKNSLKNLENISEKLADLEVLREELKVKMQQYKEEYTVLTKTADFLKKADENLKVKYRAPLQESLNKYLIMIAGNDVKANIDIDLNVTVEEKGKEWETEYFSKGYQNLFEICKRFALTDVLFTAEKPFIILDDPFYNLDDSKIVSALELVKKLSTEYQILYFVCHESRRA